MKNGNWRNQEALQEQFHEDMVRDDEIWYLGSDICVVKGKGKVVPVL
jgi:pyruvate/2-oxoglutarate/acetoin dehydrogenase E1 component